MDAKKLIELADHPYVALIPYDTTLAPLVASEELTREYVTADRMFQKLLSFTYEETDENGHKHVIIPRELSFWFQQKVDILKTVAKLNALAGVKEVDVKLDVLKMVMSDKDLLTPDQRKEIAKKLMEKQAHGQLTTPGRPDQ